MAGTELRIRDQVGPHAKNPIIADLLKISDEGYAAYHRVASVAQSSGQTGKQFAVARMMHIAESTSTAVAMTATWTLSMPAMSLVRDRYEQTVRFSWLARQKSDDEWHKYLGSYFSKVLRLNRSLQPEQLKQMVRIGARFEPWVDEPITKEQREYLERWEKMRLDWLAAKRDTLPAVGNIRLDRETLADLYSAIYGQFSSVSHYDFYALQMIGMFRSPTDEWVLAPHPFWPELLIVYTCLFDLIQCWECTMAHFDLPDANIFTDLHDRWRDCLKRHNAKTDSPE